MKIWNSYGSEHSARLVMIGSFKDESSAERTKEIIDAITEFASTHDEQPDANERYSKDFMELLKRVNTYTLTPGEIDQFRYGIQSELKRNTLVFSTNEIEISAFVKLLIDNGAKVELYSTHDYPDPEDDTNVS